MSWNALRNDNDLDDFFARIYERSRSRSHMMRPTIEDEDIADPMVAFEPCLVPTFVARELLDNLCNYKFSFRLVNILLQFFRPLAIRASVE